MQRTFVQAVDVVYDIVIHIIDGVFGYITRILFGRRESVETLLLNGPTHTHDGAGAAEGTPSAPAGEAHESVSEQASTARTFRSTADIIGAPAAPTGSAKNTVMYTAGADVPLCREPVLAYDSVLLRLPYAAMVMVREQSGRWARVIYGEQEGWILREDLVPQAADVFPHFHIGEPNEAEDPNTLRVRAAIGDEFSGTLARLPLQSAEYVTYRLLRKNKTIPWPNVRPRTEGTWHTILGGVRGVHIGVQPKTDSIVEYELPDGRGHVAYVESVFPDNTIKISETNYPDRGIYNERVLTKEEWREVRPVFITIS